MAGIKPAGNKPAGNKPAGNKPAGIKPAGNKPAGIKPAGIKPAISTWSFSMSNRVIARSAGVTGWSCLGAAVVMLVSFPTICGADTKQDYECSAFWQPGCAQPYNCSAWTSQACDGGGTSMSKKGFAVQFHICIVKFQSSCEETRVHCYKEEYYVQSGCEGGLCKVLYNWADGCSFPT